MAAFLGCIDKYIDILDGKSMTKLLKSVYARIHDRQEDDKDLQDFFKFKCWIWSCLWPFWHNLLGTLTDTPDVINKTYRTEDSETMFVFSPKGTFNLKRGFSLKKTYQKWQLQQQAKLKYNYKRQVFQGAFYNDGNRRIAKSWTITCYSKPEAICWLFSSCH